VITADHRILPEFPSQVDGLGLAQPEDEQTHLGRPGTVVADAEAWPGNQASARHLRGELFVSPGIDCCAEEMGAWIMGRHDGPGASVETG
jgi:hypothetical protein